MRPAQAAGEGGEDFVVARRDLVGVVNRRRAGGEQVRQRRQGAGETFSATLCERTGFAERKILIKSRPDVYVVPRDVVVEWLGQRQYTMNKSKWIYCYNFRPSIAEQGHETPDLRNWRNRFDLIERAIG